VLDRTSMQIRMPREALRKDSSGPPAFFLSKAASAYER
jgi:hypothetical protein